VQSRILAYVQPLQFHSRDGAYVEVEIALSDTLFPQTTMFVRSFLHKSAYGRDIAEHTCNVDGSRT
jgi:hypothetical protein